MNNINESENTSENMAEINKFDLSFLSDIKRNGISVYKISDTGNLIVLEDRIGNDIQYIYESNNIYRIENENEKIKISENISDFSASLDNNKITVTIKINDKEIFKQYKLGKY